MNKGFKQFAKDDEQIEEFIISKIEAIKGIKDNNEKLAELHKLFKDVFRAVVFRNETTGTKYCEDILGEVFRNETKGLYTDRKKTQ